MHGRELLQMKDGATKLPKIGGTPKGKRKYECMMAEIDLWFHANVLYGYVCRPIYSHCGLTRCQIVSKMVQQSQFCYLAPYSAGLRHLRCLPSTILSTFWTQEPYGPTLPLPSLKP